MQQDLGIDLAELRADGGASQNALLMQFQADLTDRPISASTAPEVSALGAAALAFEGLGIATTTAAPGARFTPHMTPDHRSDHLARWSVAIRQTLTQ